MNLSQIIEKWEKEMDKTIDVAMMFKDDYKRMIFLCKHTAISDILEDLKKLNEETQSEAEE